VEIPPDLAASTDIDVDFVYASGTGTNDIVWTLSYESIGDGDDADDDAGETDVTCTADTVPAADVVAVHDCGTDLTAANLTAGEFLKLVLGRAGADVADTHAADANLLGVRLTYTSTRP
jgi:hypothetical protein